MHKNNRKFLRDLRKKYSEFMNFAKVLELGSKNITGTVRSFFKNCEYIGVDIESDSCVDIVCEAKKTRFEEGYFDTIACFSLLEHDLNWRDSLKNNLRWLKKGGMIFMCWGAEDNIPHMEVWKLVPHKEVIDFLEENEIEILDSFFEEDRYGKDCSGAYDLVGIKK